MDEAPIVLWLSLLAEKSVSSVNDFFFEPRASSECLMLGSFCVLTLRRCSVGSSNSKVCGSFSSSLGSSLKSVLVKTVIGTVLVIRGTIGGFLGRAVTKAAGPLLLERVGGAKSSSSDEPSRRLTEVRGASRLLCMSIMLGIDCVYGLLFAVDSSRL